MTLREHAAKELSDALGISEAKAVGMIDRGFATRGVYTCTRRLEFDAAHRVPLHGGKCRSLHGHRYVVEVRCESDGLDGAGVVIDFGLIKERVGGWIDEFLDHTTIFDRTDAPLRDMSRIAEADGQKPFYAMQNGPPTAEVLARHLCEVAQGLLEDGTSGIRVLGVRVWETPNCYADWVR